MNLPLWALATTAFAAFKPPVRMNVSEWADTYRRLSSESSAEVGQWKTDRAPYQRGMMDACQERGVLTVVLMTSAQIGKTEILLNLLGYHIHLDPSPILFLQPTLDMAESVSKTRLATMIRDVPELSALIADPKSRDSGNTLLTKNFPGGHVTLVGANSPSSLASRPIRVVIADEVDRYPSSAGTEGDPLLLATKRTATFRNRRIVMVSTPTVKGQSRIEKAWDTSDKRRFHVPCPHCNSYQPLVWERIAYDEKEPEEGRRLVEYQCIECGVFIDESHKRNMLEKGRWVATGKYRGHIGFHINELYSPWRRWVEIVEDYLKAREDSQMLKVWWNTSLGLPFEEQGEVPDAQRLFERRERYAQGSVPEGGLFLTAGVDVQADRIECQVVAWGAGLESWSVDFRRFFGESNEPEVWNQLRDYLRRAFPHASGTKLAIQKVALDTGYRTSDVYRFTRTFPTGLVLPIKGQDRLTSPLGTPKKVEFKPKTGKKNRQEMAVHQVGVSYLKSELYGWLRLPMPTGEGESFTPGYCHFPEYDKEFFLQLTAEQLVTEINQRTRRPKSQWVLMRPRNEALDTWIYARAAAAYLGADDFGPARWTSMREDLKRGAAPDPENRPIIRWKDDP